MDDSGIDDVDDSLEPEHRSQPAYEPDGIAWGGIVLGIWAIGLIIFSVQNAEQVTVDFLGWSFQMPIALLVMVTALATLVVAGVGSYWYRRRRRKRRARSEATRSTEN